MAIVKKLFTYLHGTADDSIHYLGRSRPDRVLDAYGFVAANWARDLDNKVSTSGYVFNLFEGDISWMSKK